MALTLALSNVSCRRKHCIDDKVEGGQPTCHGPDLEPVTIELLDDASGSETDSEQESDLAMLKGSLPKRARIMATCQLTFDDLKWKRLEMAEEIAEQNRRLAKETAESCRRVKEAEAEQQAQRKLEKRQLAAVRQQRLHDKRRAAKVMNDRNTINTVSCFA